MRLQFRHQSNYQLIPLKYSFIATNAHLRLRQIDIQHHMVAFFSYIHPCSFGIACNVALHQAQRDYFYKNLTILNRHEYVHT